MDKSLVRNHGDATLVALHAAADHAGNRPEEHKASNPVDEEDLLVVLLDLVRVFPWNTLWASHVLAETVGDPGVRS